MKKIIGLILFLGCSFLVAQTPALKISFEKKTTHPPEVLERFAALGPEGLLSANVAMPSVLLYQNGKSCFYSLALDTLIGNVPVRSSGENAIYYFKNHKESLLHRSSFLTSPQKGTNEALREINKWQLRPDLPAKVILGYKCSAASLTEKSGEVVAWYTPDLPFSDGPEWYGVLPGLILQVEKKMDVITAIKIEILHKDLPIDLNYKPAEILTLEAFKAAVRRANGL